MQRPKRGFDWLQSLQRTDGAWHQYYLTDGIEEDKLDAELRRLCRCRGLVPLVDLPRPWRPRGDVADGARRDRLRARAPAAAGEIIWARHADCDTVHVRVADRVVVDLSQPVAARSPSRASWDMSAELGAGRLAAARSSGGQPRPSHRTAGRWTVLPGAVRRGETGAAGRQRLEPRRDGGSPSRGGIWCVWTRPWITAAGDVRMCDRVPGGRRPGLRPAAVLLGATPSHRRRPLLDRHRGTEEVNFPGGEQSTYTAAAVILAADALGRSSATSGLFTDHSSLPSVVHQHEDPDHPGRS